MGQIIDMADFEHLRRPSTDGRYTCPKTDVTFPQIYKVTTPDGELEDDVPVFNGEYSVEYRLKEPSSLEQIPGFPPLTATKISTLDARDDFYLDVIHFSNKEKAMGFREACGYLGIEAEDARLLKVDRGAFVLLRRKDSPKKNGHIIYHSTGLQYFEALRSEMECEYVAAFTPAGELARINEIEDRAE